MTTLRTAAIGLFALFWLAAARPHERRGAGDVRTVHEADAARRCRFAPVKGGAGRLHRQAQGARRGHATKAAPTDFAATKPGAGQSHERRVRRPANATPSSLEQTHDRLLGGIGAASAKLYSYRYSVNGFAAQLDGSASLAARAERRGRAHLARHRPVCCDTNNSAIFLGLQDPDGGLRADLGLRGENIVVGIIDSGVAPQPPVAARHRGSHAARCAAASGRSRRGSAFGSARRIAAIRRRQSCTTRRSASRAPAKPAPASSRRDCNNKVVGARFYLDGFLARHELDPGEFRSPKDADGHGTHVATIDRRQRRRRVRCSARASHASAASRRARASPSTRRAGSSRASTRGTCATSDLVRAIDDAVADGVDLINYSRRQPRDRSRRARRSGAARRVRRRRADGRRGRQRRPRARHDRLAEQRAVGADDGGVDAGRRAIRRRRSRSRRPPISPARFADARGVVHAAAIERGPDRGGSSSTADDGVGGAAARRAGSARDACEPLTNSATTWTAASRSSSAAAASSRSRSRNAEDAGAIAVVVYDNCGRRRS